MHRNTEKILFQTVEFKITIIKKETGFNFMLFHTDAQFSEFPL